MHVKKNGCRTKTWSRTDERIVLIEKFLAETGEIVAFCNTAMRKTLTTIGFGRGPILSLGARFIVNGTLAETKTKKGQSQEEVFPVSASRRSCSTT